MSRFVLVTGTDTGVGKTVTTAALAVLHESRDDHVVVVKPVQTGVAEGEGGDLGAITRLTGLNEVQEFARLRAPLAPDSAARIEGVTLPTIAETAERIRRISADVVIVEGAGGLLVRLDLAGGTMLDLALALGGDVVVVGREGLGTLNHFALTVDKLRAHGIEPELVLGSCSSKPGLAERSNHEEVPRVTGRPIVGRIPGGAGRLSREDFRAQAPGWFL